jgi:3-dehydroquinate dehydratase/shikimate dehydrogenase
MAIVVSHLAPDFETLARRALRQAPLADLIELRLDHIGDPGEDRLAKLIRALGKPVIVALNGPEAHGAFAGTLEERLAILHMGARAGAMFVDVDWRLSLELGPVHGKCHRIVSRHELEGTPEDLAALDEEVRAVLHEGDAVKLVTHARSSEDGLRVLRHLRTARGGLVAFASGEKGSFTRVLAPIFGSPFTYAAPAAQPGEPAPPRSAPGQLRVNELRALFPPGGASTQTAVFAVVGRPIAHSLSPRVHGMALKAARLDAVYVALEPESLEGLLELCTDDNWRGFSVTAPFKEAAFSAAGASDADSQKSRASNTLVRDKAGWRAFNTDVPAIRETLERAFEYHARKPGRARVAQGGLAGQHALVLGAGGAARAAVLALQGSGGRATLAARDPAKAKRVAGELGCASIAWADIPACGYDILVHATPVGSAGRGAPDLPIAAEWIQPGTLVLDAVYRPIKTALLAAAAQRGCTPVPGAEWFVRQAAAQFKLFTHQDARDDLLRAAFENAIKDEGGGD